MSAHCCFLCVTTCQSNLIDLKDHASSLATSSLKKDSKLKTLEMAIEQKKEECSKLETQLQKVGVHQSPRFDLQIFHRYETKYQH